MTARTSWPRLTASATTLYGDPVNGYQPPEGGAAPEAVRRACIGLAGVVAATWPYAEPTQSQGNHRWADFDPSLVTVFRESFPDLPPAALALALRVWGRMHGLVALEIYGHLAGQTQQPAKLYRAELLDLLAALHVPDKTQRR